MNAKRCAWVQWLPWLVPTCEAGLGKSAFELLLPSPLVGCSVRHADWRGEWYASAKCWSAGSRCMKLTSGCAKEQTASAQTTDAIR